MAVQEKVQEITATVSNEKDVQLQLTMAQVSQLEIALNQKEEVRNAFFSPSTHDGQHRHAALGSLMLSDWVLAMCHHRCILISVSTPLGPHFSVLIRSSTRAGVCTPLRSVR